MLFPQRSETQCDILKIYCADKYTNKLFRGGDFEKLQQHCPAQISKTRYDVRKKKTHIMPIFFKTIQATLATNANNNRDAQWKMYHIHTRGARNTETICVHAFKKTEINLRRTLSTPKKNTRILLFFGLSEKYLRQRVAETPLSELFLRQHPLGHHFHTFSCMILGLSEFWFRHALVGRVRVSVR